MVYQKCLKLSINTVYTNDFGNLNLSRQMVISVISNLIFFVHVDLCEAKTYWELCSGLDVERPYPDRRCISVAIPGGVMLGMSVKVFCLMSSAFNVPNLPNISWKIFGRLRDLLLKSGWPKNTWMVSQKTKRFWEESRIVAATLLPAARTFIFADSWRGSTNSAWFFVLWLRWGSFFFPKQGFVRFVSLRYFETCFGCHCFHFSEGARLSFWMVFPSKTSTSRMLSGAWAIFGSGRTFWIHKMRRSVRCPQCSMFCGRIY